MLYALQKYTVASVFNRNIKLKITNRARQALIKTPKNVLYVYKYIQHSTFLRKSYFRSMLLYLNILYANLNTSPDANFFYPYVYPVIRYSETHPSFYFRNYVVR